MRRLKRHIAGGLAVVLLMAGFLPCTGPVNVKAKDNYDQVKQAVAASREEAFQEDYEWLTFDQIKGDNRDAEHVASNLRLPVTGNYGSKIFWSTSDSSSILNSGVVMPDKIQKNVTLTARIVSGTVETEKQFPVTVLSGEPDQKPLHILQVGDSNTEFARITQGMNEVLKETYGDYGDGFLTLAKEFIGTGTIRPEHFNISYSGTWAQHDLGGSDVYNSPFGIYMDTMEQGAAVTVTFAGSAVDLYYLSMGHSGKFRVVIDNVDKGIIDQSNPEGQMTVKKAVFEDLEYGQHTMVLTNTDGGHVNFYGADYRVDDAVIRKNISTWGNGGIQAYEYANSLNPEIFEQSMSELDPDVVTILIGTNDNGGSRTPEVFGDSLTTMIQRTKKAVPHAEIWVISTFETLNPTEGLNSYWDRVFPETAAKEGVHYWAMGEWFGPYSSDYMEDPWHCDRAGGRKIAEKMHEVILGGKDVAGRIIESACENKAVQAKTGTPFTELELPDRIPVILDDLQKSVVTADVEWSSAGYETDKKGTYTLKGKIQDDQEQRIYNPDHVQAVIQVQVTDDYEKKAEKGLRLYYDFSGIQGNTVKDLAGEHDGTIIGNVTIADGVEGEAAYFPKDAASYVDIPKEAFEYSKDVTISAWMKLEEVSTWTTMLGGGTDTTNYFQLVASGIPSTGACGLSAGIKETKGKEYRVNAASEDKPVPGEWCMVTYTQKGSTGKLYLDGELKATSNAVRRTIKDVVSAQNAKVCLGATPVWPDPATKGAIDEFKVYDYAMTAQEVKEQRYPDKAVISIEITNAPEKMEYVAGEKLDLTGMVITGKCADGTCIDLTNECKVTGYDSEKTGKQTITVTYKDKSAVFTVTVAKKENPNKPVYEIFSDISKEDWYVDDVQYVYDKKIMLGMTDTSFGSNTILTRSHFATILYRMEGEPKVEYAERFHDVPDGEFYTSPVICASSEGVGVISGYEDGNFGPNDSITREQMAVMLYRYAKFKKYNTSDTNDLKGFADQDKVSLFADEAMKWAVGAELIRGEEDGKQLNPQGKTSRAVCAAIMQRFMSGYDK